MLRKSLGLIALAVVVGAVVWIAQGRPRTIQFNFADLHAVRYNSFTDDRFAQFFRNQAEQLEAHSSDRTADGRLVLSVLSLSGGGGDGAFGAGTLNGWTELGTRPDFHLVSGISAGALIAPFAFLGPKYDDALKRVFTQTNTSDILSFDPVRGLLFGQSMYNSAPLLGLISEFVTEQFLSEIATQHGRGRRLLVGTTELGTVEPFFWDMGAIASKANAEALDLFRSVLLASASIPAIFPPVLFAVTDGPTKWVEVHVDGGVSQNYFLTTSTGVFQRAYSVKPVARVFILVNGKVQWGARPRAAIAGISSILKDSISMILQRKQYSDLIVDYTGAARSGVDFRFLYVPTSYPGQSVEMFDQIYMADLFEFGRRHIVSNPNSWYVLPHWDAGPPLNEPDPPDEENQR